VRRSTSAEPGAIHFYRGEETPALLATVPRTRLEMLWSRLGKSPDCCWGASFLAPSADAPQHNRWKVTISLMPMESP